MEPLIVGLIAVVVGLAVGAIATWLVARARANAVAASSAAQHLSEIALLSAQHETALASARAQAGDELARLQSDAAAAQASVDALREQVAAAAAQYKDLVDRGERDARERQAREQAESKVLQELAPVKETLISMQRKVIDLEEQRREQHGQLSQQLRAATEGEERLRQTAESLAAALKNNAVRGVWGETQLRTLVESAGLLAHVDFSEQTTILVDDVSRRPDMVVHLPGGKEMAIDSKVPYNDYIEAAGTIDDDERRKDLLGRHAKKVKGHVDALSARGYWSGLEASPEFTIAFIPNESLLSAAHDSDPTLMDYALSKGVILASPITLWAVLKTVAFTWRQDVLTEDAKRLFDLSRELYSRISTLAEHADKLRRSIDGTVSAYNAFASSLETRVLVTARKLNEVDESKLIPTANTVEGRPKDLTAAEFADAQLEIEVS
jgi:DNA recombination protein RmuC